MHPLIPSAVAVTILLAATCAAAASPRVLAVHPGPDRWKSATVGPYQVRLDIRDLYQINAFWERSRAGNYGAITTRVTLPSDWVRPIRLRFFQADDYQAWGIDRSRAADWFIESGFVGHRFKQVLVNGRLAWEQDVADPGTGQYYEVDLSWAVSPGQPFELTFRLFDRVPSDQVLEGDYLRLRAPQYRAQDHPAWHDEAAGRRFETRSYWGDVAFYDAVATDAAVAATGGFDWLKGARPKQAWHRGSRGAPPPGPLRLRLETDAPGPLPAGGYPVRCGVPFAQGMLKPGQAVALLDPRGKRVPLQTAVLARWGDGSTKWLLLDFIAQPEGAEKRYAVVWHGVERAPVARGLKVQRTPQGVLVNTGALRFRVLAQPGPTLLADIAAAGSGPRIVSLTGLLECRTQDAEEKETPGPRVRYRAVRESVTVESAGPIRATLKIQGRLVDASGRSLGDLVVRATAWAGLPYLHLFHRVFNGSDRHRRLDLSRLTLTASEGGAAWAGLPTLRCERADAQHPGPEGIVAAPGFGLGVRHFWQQFPKAIVPEGQRLHVDLFAGSAPDSVHNWFACGEAKRHEVLLSFASREEENRRALQAFQAPPRLFDAAWHCRSGGWGPAAPHSDARFPELHQAMGRIWKSWRGIASWGQEYGIRNFGDGRYGDNWYNNYYDMARALLVEYAMGGERWHFHRGETMVRHLMDVDQVHPNAADSPPTPPAGGTGRRRPGVGAMAGSIRAFGYSRHHNLTPVTDCKSLSTRAYLDYYHMTGDPDAREAALSIADYIARSGTGLGGRSSREQAFPLTALMVVYQETRNPGLLKAARRLFEDTLCFGKRRGAYVEPFMSHEYLANGGGMVCHLTEGMMLYWAETGDRRAAEAIVALASAVLAENTGGPEALPCYWTRRQGRLELLPEGQGERGCPGVTHYSGNPYQKNWSPEYVFLVCQAFAYAYDLTGKREFLEAARGGYEEAARTDLLCSMYVYWQAPVLLFYLQHFGRR